MMTSKDRAELRAKANTLDTTLIIGKNGVTDAVVEEVNILLDSHELVKGKVLETALLSAREACDAVCEATGAEGVQVVGTKFVIYRFSEKLAQERKAKEKAEKKKKAVNPVRAGAQARRKAEKEEKARRDRYFHDAAVKAAIERRKNGESR